MHTLSCKCDLVTMSPLEYLCHRYDKICGHIYEIYTILTYTSTKLSYMVKWEQAIQEGLELEDWHSIALAALRSLINTSSIAANYKVLLRWYIVLARLATYVPGAVSKCFRGWGQEGTAYHIWWQCLKVRKFWIRV